MNYMSLNVRDIGDDVKLNWIRRLKMLHKVSFVGLQETQLTEYSHIDVRECWDSSNYVLEGVNSCKRSSGLISIWDTG